MLRQSLYITSLSLMVGSFLYVQLQKQLMLQELLIWLRECELFVAIIVSSLSLCRSALSVATIGTADRRVRSESVGQYSVSCVSERSGTYGPGWLPPVRFYVWFYFLLYSQFLFILLLSKTAKVRLDF